MLSNTKFAPIILFTYNRLDHTRTVVESLLENAEAVYSDLYIFSDGPKSPADKQKVAKTRLYLHVVKEKYSLESYASGNSNIINGFKSVTLIERDCNWGLYKNIINGVTDIINRYGRVIVVEDDIIVSRYFLQYMNDALAMYENDGRIASVSAFLNPVKCNVPESFFLSYFACWGWATWKRAWDLLETDSRKMLKELRWKTNKFNIGGTGPFYGILYCHNMKYYDSWAILFYTSCFLKNKLHLFPGRTMAIQSGMDGSGTNCVTSDIYSNMNLSDKPIMLKDIEVVQNKTMYKAFSDFYALSSHPESLRFKYNRFKSFVRRLIGIDYR